MDVTKLFPFVKMTENYGHVPIHLSGYYCIMFLYKIIGIESDELTIHTSLFSHYKTVETLQVRLMVTDTTTGITGKTYQNLVRNHPPRGGNCTIDPATGTAGMTNHTIECSGFYDIENEIEDYRILCEFMQ